MIRLRRMMPAGVWPRDMNTTMVAPIRPASVNSCQGCSASEPSLEALTAELVEVSELIVQTGVERRVVSGRLFGPSRSGPMRPATCIHDDRDQPRPGEHVRQCPRQPVEAAVLGNRQYRLAVIVNEGGDDLVVGFPVRNELSNTRALLGVAVDRKST